MTTIPDVVDEDWNKERMRLEALALEAATKLFDHTHASTTALPFVRGGRAMILVIGPPLQALDVTVMAIRQFADNHLDEPEVRVFSVLAGHTPSGIELEIVEDEDRDSKKDN